MDKSSFHPLKTVPMFVAAPSFTHQLLCLIAITAALELSRFNMCLCVVCAFVCFSSKKMPSATKLLLQKPMPSPTCCYCGTEIPKHRTPRRASAQHLTDAATWRCATGKHQLSWAEHVCETHRRHPPSLTQPTQVKRNLPTTWTATMHGNRCNAHTLLCATVGKFLLRVYRRVQQLQQSRRDAYSATLPTSLHYASPRLHAALRALPASVRSSRACRLSSATLSRC
jgi:hypothetical protein